MKTFISISLIILLSVINTILSYFTFSYQILLDPNYWIAQVVTQIPIVIIILVMRSLYKQREGEKNTDVLNAKKIIDRAYVTIHTSTIYLNTFKSYVAADNRARKLEVYLGSIERKLLKQENIITHINSVIEQHKHRDELKAEKRRILTGRDTKKSSLLWRVRTAYYSARLATATTKRTLYESQKTKAEEVIDFVKVKYNAVSYATLFTDREKVQADTRDLTIHEGRDVGTLIGTKILGIVAVGVLFSSTFVFNMEGGALDIVYSIVFKLLQTALAIYTGATSGTMFIRDEVLLRLKLRVTYLQEFLAAQKNDEVIADFGELLGNTPEEKEKAQYVA